MVWIAVVVRGWLCVALCLASCNQERDSATTYACRNQQTERPLSKTTPLPIKDKKIMLTRNTCVPGAYARGNLGGLGSWSIQVTSLDWGMCVFELKHEIEGAYEVELCKVIVEETAQIPLRDHRLPIVNNCAQVRSGSLREEWNERPHETQLNIPGTNFVVWASSQPGQLPLTFDPNSPPVTLGATVKIAYQLYEDTAYAVASRLPGASGELVYHHGAGEVGQAIERLFSTNSKSTARSNRLKFRAEVAHGIRDKLPGFAPDAQFCADVAIIQVTAPATPLQGPTPCPTGEQWFCQLGPTSVDNTTSARGCGCGLEVCPSYGFRWTTDTGEKWPDGSHKLKYECVDDTERIRRARQLLPQSPTQR